MSTCWSSWVSPSVHSINCSVLNKNGPRDLATLGLLKALHDLHVAWWHHLLLTQPLCMPEHCHLRKCQGMKIKQSKIKQEQKLQYVIKQLMILAVIFTRVMETLLPRVILNHRDWSIVSTWWGVPFPSPWVSSTLQPSYLKMSSVWNNWSMVKSKACCSFAGIHKLVGDWSFCYILIISITLHNLNFV